jgi:hypothetical protein
MIFNNNDGNIALKYIYDPMIISRGGIPLQNQAKFRQIDFSKGGNATRDKGICLLNI